MTEQPMTEQPMTEQPMTEQPMTEQPMTEQTMTGQTIRFPDVLTMEYVPMPQIDLDYRVLYRFVAPVATAWQLGAVFSIVELMPEVGGGQDTVEASLQRFGAERWQAMLKEAGLEGAPKRVLAIECEIVPKVVLIDT